MAQAPSLSEWSCPPLRLPQLQPQLLNQSPANSSFSITFVLTFESLRLEPLEAGMQEVPMDSRFAIEDNDDIPAASASTSTSQSVPDEHLDELMDMARGQSATGSA